MSDEPDYILEISTAPRADDPAPPSSRSGSSSTSPPSEARPWIGVHFECCGIYARIYRRPDSPVYAGQCPRCLARITARVGADGTPQRLFRAS